MRFIFLITLLAFPIAEIWILISLADEYGWWVMLYLVVAALLGLQLIRDEKLLFSGRIVQTLTQGGNPIKAIFGSARNIIAGILLIIPGVMTDIIAAVLLLIPVNKQPSTASYQHSTEFDNASYSKPGQNKRAANDDVIEGEFHRED